MKRYTRKNLHIKVLYFEGCPNSVEAYNLTKRVADGLGIEEEVKYIEIKSAEEAAQTKFAGSPTILIGDRDISGREDVQPFFGCRVYEDHSGIPPRWMIEAAITRELRPSHYLFMCVANSARSQMAEGIARYLSGEKVKISSAGSDPSTVHPLAIKALAEIGIDISDQYSKGLDLIDVDSVDAIFTLCAEEVCPIFPGDLLRVHWGMPDPVVSSLGVDTPDIQAFRKVRDELVKRLEIIFTS